MEEVIDLSPRQPLQQQHCLVVSKWEEPTNQVLLGYHTTIPPLFGSLSLGGGIRPPTPAATPASIAPQPFGSLSLGGGGGIKPGALTFPSTTPSGGGSIPATTPLVPSAPLPDTSTQVTSQQSLTGGKRTTAGTRLGTTAEPTFSFNAGALIGSQGPLQGVSGSGSQLMTAGGQPPPHSGTAPPQDGPSQGLKTSTSAQQQQQVAADKGKTGGPPQPTTTAPSLVGGPSLSGLFTTPGGAVQSSSLSSSSSSSLSGQPHMQPPPAAGLGLGTPSGALVSNLGTPGGLLGSGLGTPSGPLGSAQKVAPTGTTLPFSFAPSAKTTVQISSPGLSPSGLPNLSLPQTVTTSLGQQFPWIYIKANYHC